MGIAAIRKYVVLNLITGAGGGLEHRNSVCLMTNRWATHTRRAYIGWLGLVSHEYFHAWNIKRLRPVELGPFDYENENPTRSLWISEGFTDYYGPLTVRRARLSTEQEYLGNTAENPGGGLSGLINGLQTTPGRLVQTAEQASWDAWIKLYRPDENTNNTSIELLHEGWRNRMAAGYPNPALHKRREIAGRSDAGSVRPLLGPARIHTG